MKNITARTPYDIRLELLQLAHTIAFNQHQVAANNLGVKGIISSPTPEEVVEIAEKLKEFISNNH